MRFAVEYPIATPQFHPSFLDPATMSRFAAELEAAGVDTLMFSDHPAPSAKWLAGGGHATFDPLTALAFCAATTTRLRLMTCLLVLPYRNPLLAAKQIATADVLSGGRIVVGVGAGYLRSEFGALGVDFDERNALFDEALDVLTSMWVAPSFALDGRHFTARDQVCEPGPVQRPHPPIYVGGNSRAARERVARCAQGWAPMIADETVARSTRTAALATFDDLRAGIADLHTLVTAAGRDLREVAVQVHWATLGAVDDPTDVILGRLEQAAAVGVTDVAVRPPVDDVDRCLDAIAAYGRDVIAPARAW
jgi:probable F420-dependent oxidoreductase